MPKSAHNLISKFITLSYHMLHACTGLQQQFLLEEDIPKKSSILAEHNERSKACSDTHTGELRGNFLNSTFNSKFLHQFIGFFFTFATNVAKRL